MTRYKFMISIIEDLVRGYSQPKTIRRRRTAEKIQASRHSPQPIAAPAHIAQPADDGHDLKRLPVGKKGPMLLLTTNVWEPVTSAQNVMQESALNVTPFTTKKL